MSNKTMKAACLTAPRRIEIVDAPVPDPADGQVRVKHEGCGVCASNLPPFEGREWFEYPMPPGHLGHEAWGIVDAVGPHVAHFKAGDRVATLGQDAYAEYGLSDAASTLKLPRELDGRDFPGEPLACAVNILRRSGIKPGDTVAIVGVGFLGALLCRLATDAGATVIAITRRACALQFARDFGAAAAVPMEDHHRIIADVKELTAGKLCDVVIECTGKQWPLDLSGELVREHGRLVIAGYHQDGLRQVNLQLWNWKGLDVINAHERVPQTYIDGMKLAAELVASAKLDPAPLFTHRFGLQQLAEALQLTADRPEGFMKALIVMS